MSKKKSVSECGGKEKYPATAAKKRHEKKEMKAAEKKEKKYKKFNPVKF